MRSFILLGKELKTNKEEGYFQPLGYLTFEAYIESPMVGMGRRSVYSLIAIYETFVEELGYSLDELSEVDYSKLDRILPVINVQPVAHREWFEKAKTLPRRVLEQEVRETWEQENKRIPTPSAPALPDNGLADWLNTVQCGDCLELLQQLPDDSIDCCVTSPPYWALRDFGVEGQLGMEESFHDYLRKLSLIFDEVRRVLKPEGTCWVNMGDTYSKGQNTGTTRLPNKCLLQIPARFSIGMCNRSWILRNEIIWLKPNCIPLSVKDRFTVDFEKLFFFTKSERYWFETQREEPKAIPRASWDNYGGESWHGHKDDMTKGNVKAGERVTHPEGRNKRSVWKIPTQPFPEAHFAVFPEKLIETPIKAGCPEFICTKCGVAREKVYETTYTKKTSNISEERLKGVAKRAGGESNDETMGYKTRCEAIRRESGYTHCNCNAGLEGGIVLDPFCGSGTTLIVAKKLGRKYIGFDINPEYAEMARKRLCH